MSKYLDFIGTKIKKQNKHETAIVLGSALIVTLVAKHLANKKETTDQNVDNYIQQENQTEDEFSFLDQATEQFDPFEDEFTYDVIETK